MSFTVGNSPDVTLNSICASGTGVGGTIKDGGWYSCPKGGLLGYFIGFFMPDIAGDNTFNIMEITAYS